MSAAEFLRIRKDEMARRVEAMPGEVAAWDASVQAQLDLHLHFSQIQAIKTLTNAFAQGQRTQLATLDPGGDTTTFQRACMALSKDVLRGQYAWDFFRDKLDLRQSSFKEQLWVADTIAWDCHRPVLQQAALVGVIGEDEFREPPLVYLGAGYSPLTWVRHSRPNDGRKYDLGESTLPIPVIEIPWDHVDNAWELLSLHHEVGHDIEADLRLRPALRTALADQLRAAGVQDARISTWLRWLGEIFADLCALQLAGPAFADTLMHLLLLPPEMVLSRDDEDPHPTPYLRMRMNATYIRTLVPGNPALADHADRIDAGWEALYGKDASFDVFIGDLPVVFRALMDTPLEPIANGTLRSFMPYTLADDQRVRDAAGYFVTGMNKPVGLRPRHCVSASRLAVSAMAAQGPVPQSAYDEVQSRLLRLVRAGATSGLRGTVNNAHNQFIAKFAKEVFS